jgi:nitrate/nitrite-specific signal transduction histidine kinase
MMTLRVRLLLGYGYLVALLLLAAGGAMLGFLKLSASIDVVLDENFKSTGASMRMLEALERQDSVTLAALLEGEAEVADMRQLEADFAAALETARSNVSEEAEQPVIDALGSDYAAYHKARDQLLSERPERPLAAYKDRVFPFFSAVKNGVVQLLDINHNAMIQADREAKETATQNGAWLGFLVTIALVSLVFLSRAMQRQILSRLGELRKGMAAIAYGDPTRRLREHGSDELAAVAHHFNEILDRRQQLENRLQGRLALERRLVLALAERLGPRTALYGLSGNLLVGHLDDGTDGEGVEAWIRGEGRRRLGEWQEPEEEIREVIDLAGGPAEVSLLVAATTRPAGWLVRQLPSEA